MFSIPTHSPLCNLFLSPLIEQNNNILSLSSTVIGSLTLPRCPKSLYLSALLEKSKTPSALWVCACPLSFFKTLCFPLCGRETKGDSEQWPWLRSGQLLYMCASACFQSVCPWVCVTTRRWWQLKRNWAAQRSVPSWCPCHFMALFPSLNLP